MEKLSKLIDYNTLIMLLELNKDKTIVIDEFHRMPKLLDEFHRLDLKRNILLSSTSWYLKTLLEHENPLLEYAKERLSLASPSEVIKSLKLSDHKELIESSLFLREVFFAPYYNDNVLRDITNFLYGQRYFIDSLIKDIFIEERKELSSIHLRIMRLIANGKVTYHEIQEGVKDITEGLISSYLQILKSLDLVRSIEVYGKERKRYYEIKSPIIYLHLYIDSKYEYLENDIPSDFIKNVVQEKMNVLVEKFFRDLFEEIHGMKSIKIMEPEVDIALVKFNKLHFVGEVKWGNIRKIDILKTIENLSKFNTTEKVLIVRDKKEIEKYKSLLDEESIKIMDSKDIVTIVRNQKTPVYF